MAITLDGTTGVTAAEFDGTVDASNLTGTLPAIDGSALTSLTAGNLTGALPAIDGSALTGIDTGFTAKAWVNFNGTGAISIRDDGNVSSLTDNGTGQYTTNYSSTLSSANYSATGMCGFASTSANDVGTVAVYNASSGMTTSSVRVFTVDTNAGSPYTYDYAYVGIQVTL